MDDMTQDLKAILPQSKTLVIGGEVITLRPFRFDQIPEILPRMAALMTLIENGSAAVMMAAPALLHDLHELFALATGKPVEWVQDLDAASGIELTVALAELNEGFFQVVLASLPRLVAVAERLARLVPTGQTSRPT